MEREHTRIIDEQARKPQDTTGSDDMRQQMEKIAREKAETDVVLGTLRERVSVLKDEVERLRRQVHELQQESADKEVKIVQLTKQRSQDKEDMQGLNIALDSKQQELELVSICQLSPIFPDSDGVLRPAQKEIGCQGHGRKYACSTIESCKSP
jgi:predicted nuclease with TOPRIM domain